jgi:hypothetical protein
VKKLLVVVALAACGGDDGEPETCVMPDGDGPGFEVDGALCQRLSTYRLFDDLGAQAPAAGVAPYDLNTELFSDYTTKQRWLVVPDGEAMAWERGTTSRRSTCRSAR